ncbi:RidA family protein [Natrinema ejinorense]|uniref:Enamine deaminase RidA n=1 Tax=Natrinema ejinorense TaxID=373386 RepID=A0A2A5QQ83_9EURY|nr:RidA family protein [Natrinema ejinorense]PCR89000.1 hypothetical protein CP557_21265 [Natrinema ejinorense]
MIDRTNPENVYTPAGNAYTQVIGTNADRMVHVAGTVPENESSELVGVGDMDAQIEQVMQNISRSLAAEGCDLSDVVRIRIFTTDMDAYMRAQRTVGSYFSDGECPTSTLVGVDRLADSFHGIAPGEPTDIEPRYLVEVDATAVTE